MEPQSIQASGHLALPAAARRFGWGLYTRLLAKLHARDGAASTEYALLLALVVVVLISSLSALGAELNNKLNAIILQIRGAG